MAINRFALVTFGFDTPADFDLTTAVSRANYITFGLFNRALFGAAVEEIKIALRYIRRKIPILDAVKEMKERERQMEKPLPIRSFRKKVIIKKI